MPEPVPALDDRPMPVDARLHRASARLADVVDPAPPPIGRVRRRHRTRRAALASVVIGVAAVLGLGAASLRSGSDPASEGGAGPVASEQGDVPPTPPSSLTSEELLALQPGMDPAGAALPPWRSELDCPAVDRIGQAVASDEQALDPLDVLVFSSWVQRHDAALLVDLGGEVHGNLRWLTAELAARPSALDDRATFAATYTEPDRARLRALDNGRTLMCGGAPHQVPPVDGAP